MRRVDLSLRSASQPPSQPDEQISPWPWCMVLYIARQTRNRATSILSHNRRAEAFLLMNACRLEIPISHPSSAVRLRRYRAIRCHLEMIEPISN